MPVQGGAWYTVNDSQIAHLFVPGGDAWKQTRDLGATHYRTAKAIAPSRTGNLRNMHRIVVTPNRAFTCQYTLASDAPYSDFVHNGTTGPIHADRWSVRNKFFPRRGYPFHLWIGRNRSTRGLMRIRPMPHSWYPVPWLRQTVNGQMAQPWIELAYGIAERQWRSSQRAWARSLRT